jgi:hypothetical protein
MPRITLQDVLNSRIPAAIGSCSTDTDSRVAAIINEAQQRLLSKGLWWDSYAKYRIAAYDSTIALPPQLATIESVAINHVPVPSHDMWFEFLDNGFGTRAPSTVGTAGGTSLGGATGAYGIPEADFRGNFPTFRELTPNSNAKKVVVICDLLADVTAAIKVTVLGYDANGNWIRTLVGGSYIDGEVIALAQTPGSTSVNTFSRITDVRFSVQRSGQVWLYELDTVTSVQTLTGWYQWFEMNPSYGRWLFPSIGCPQSGCTPPANAAQAWTTGEIPGPGTTCNPSLVEVIGKKAFIPVSLPTDYLIIGNIPALKFMAQAVQKEEDAVSQADLGEAIGFETKALKEMDDELDMYLGSGRRIGMNIQGSLCPGGDPIPTFM